MNECQGCKSHILNNCLYETQIKDYCPCKNCLVKVTCIEPCPEYDDICNEILGQALITAKRGANIIQL